MRMNGIPGLHGWQWLFLLEGLPSVLLGCVVLCVLPNGPLEARWLSPAEKEWISTSLEKDNANVQRVHHPSLRTIFSDWRVVHLCLIFIITSIGGNAVGFFGPKLIQARSGGHWPDWLVAVSLSVPAIVGAIAMLIAAGHSDRTGNRRIHVAIGYGIAGLGYLACVYAPSAQLILVALALNALGERIAAGSYWAVTTNLLGARAAAGGIAFINSVGNLGGFFGPILMGKLLDRSHGSFQPGLFTAFGFMIAGAILAYLLRGSAASREALTPEAEAENAAEAFTAAASQPEL